MNTLNRRDFVMGSTALGLVMAARQGFAAGSDRAPVYRDAGRSYIDYLYQMA